MHQSITNMSRLKDIFQSRSCFQVITVGLVLRGFAVETVCKSQFIYLIRFRSHNQ